jgi:hypothetical protein
MSGLHLTKYLPLMILLLNCFSSLPAEEPQNIPVDQLGKKYQLVGLLHEPLGKVITVVGVVVEGPYKGYEGGPNLRPQRIQGRATQEDIQIRLQPFFVDWGKKAYNGYTLPELELGKTYELEGYEIGNYIGHPAEALRRTNLAIQTANLYFQKTFVVIKAKKINTVKFSPRDFEGRKALLQGKAISKNNQSLMQGDEWVVVVDQAKSWPKDVVGKLIETYGMYNPVDDNEKKFSLLDGVWRLVNLEDQVGRTVELRGTPRNYWFHYRSIDLYVENMQDLPGWSPDCDWRPMIIRGILEKAKLPRVDQVSLKANRDLKEYFIVRKPSWEPLDALLSPERPFSESDE